MKVLVTGASGFLGRHVVAALAQGGHEVRALIRPVSARPAELRLGNVATVCADLRGGPGLAEALAGVSAVVHVAAATSGTLEEQLAATVAATERLLGAMKDAGVMRLILVSSFSVYGWSQMRWQLDETCPLERSLYTRDAYAIAKTWQERLVREFCDREGVALTVLRPGFIWGPGREWIDGAGIRMGRVIVINGPFRRLPLTHVKNCAACIAAVCDHAAAAGETFNVVDGQTVRAWTFARDYARRGKDRSVCVPVPYALGLLTAYAAAAVGRLVFGPFFKLPGIFLPQRYRARFRSLVFSADKLHRVIGWRAPRNYAQCLEETYGSQEQIGAAAAPRVEYA